MIMLKWFKRKWRAYAVLFFFALSFNMYFLLLMRTTQVKYLLYLDLLLLVFLAVVEGTAFLDSGKKSAGKRCFCGRMI